jgi:hypothetical protein
LALFVHSAIQRRDFLCIIFWPLASNQNELMPMAAVGREPLLAVVEVEVPL